MAKRPNPASLQVKIALRSKPTKRKMIRMAKDLGISMSQFVSGLMELPEEDLRKLYQKHFRYTDKKSKVA